MNSPTTLSARSLQYYVIALQWAADLEFFKIESAFFSHLIQNHFKQLREHENLTEGVRVNNDLSRLENEMSKAEDELTSQLKYLEMMAEDIIAEDTDKLTGRQIELEYLVSKITKEYREVKKEVFALIGRLLKQAKDPVM